jgi:hypothetical protein
MQGGYPEAGPIEHRKVDRAARTLTRAGFHFDSADVARTRRVGSRIVTLIDLNCHFPFQDELGLNDPGMRQVTRRSALFSVSALGAEWN